MTKIEKWKNLWETWDLRVVILISLILQTFLIFSAPLRKRMSKAYIVMPMWLAYLLADATANFAVGLISKSQGDHNSGLSKRHILAFWAPFLLVHLGGPDTITAFALEDNELWLRHFLGLIFQCWAVGYAFFLSFPHNKLWLPTVLMFVAGLIKYTERTRALYLASSRRFRESLLTEPDPGPNYAKLMDEYTSKKEASLPTKIEMIPEPRRNRSGDGGKSDELSDLEVVQCAYRYFDTFKGLIADLIFSFRERNQTRDFFLKRTARDAFKVVEVELNFFYEILYTKVAVVQGRFGYPLRFLSFGLTCAAIVLFYLMDKKEFKNIDIVITYILLFGAIALDLIASVMVLYSDWTAVALTKSETPYCFTEKLRTALCVGRDRWPKNPGKPWTFSFGFGTIMKIVRRRWSESLSTYNLINYCLHPRAKWWEATIDLFGLTNILDGMKYVETVDLPNDLRDFIFKELKAKSEVADDLETAKEIYSARGDWVLRLEGCTSLLRWINGVDFDQSVILWHIATELCFNRDEKSTDTNTESGNTNSGDGQNIDFRSLSKLLSDYMLYLLIMQPTMMSTVAGIGQIRFRDTCAEAKKFFRGRKIGEVQEEKNCCLSIFACGKCFCGSEVEKGPDVLQKQACKSILSVDTAVEPVAVKGDRSKSLLFDACMLAKALDKLKGQKWVIMSKVWVELLCYAACRCRANTHAAQLSKGGQLITLIWLLMAHLGLGDQFQISEGHARAKLIVRK
ncbi:transmembrane protein, putative [Actinidia rufa]|uniref:Transmembrane protein, putative n=1 Tax=Actinidia rufa TaxID=165716 RepID=A0A7J0FX36_9ERIC|nr:transmembrane protein, putative [Actinidia rufa]